MERATAAIDAFADLVERAESSSADQPKAELARYQLQALTGTLGALAGRALPVPVDEALATLRGHVSSLGGAVDREEGARLREKVAAYVVLADDLGLDRVHLDDLLRRWDALDAARRGSGRAARASSREPAGMPCPVCGELFKRPGKHMSVAHRDEWERRRGDA